MYDRATFFATLRHGYTSTGSSNCRRLLKLGINACGSYLGREAYFMSQITSLMVVFTRIDMGFSIALV